ncbi:MAG: hypothetical protein H8E46_08470 [FCB group bacterium]|nr:hypothetical protein [FCB group bacterium]
MHQQKTMQIILNPLSFLEIDSPDWEFTKKTPTCESILRYIVEPIYRPPLDYNQIIERYRSVSEKAYIFALPAEENIIEKIAGPLKNAKTSYITENYLGTIALCGMVSEMLAILLFDISEIRLNNNKMSKKQEEKLFGRRFEKLGQERRVKILSAYKLIDAETKNRFETIKNTRNKYLHLFSEKHDEISNDAKEVFLNSIELVKIIIGQEIKDGKIILNPRIISYMEKRGLVKPVEVPLNQST